MTETTEQSDLALNVLSIADDSTLPPSKRLDKIRLTCRAALAVDFADILAAAEIGSDDSMSKAPWDNCDGWEHTAERANGYDWHSDRENSNRYVYRSSREGGSVWLTLDVEKAGICTWDYFHAKGCSKQVSRELAARELACSYDQLHKWYSNGWEWWQVSIDFHGHLASCGGIDSEDYARDDVAVDCALEIAHELEAEGYTIINKPPPYNSHKASRERTRDNWRRALNPYADH